MLHMPSALIAHETLLAAFQDCRKQSRDVGLAAEVGERGEEGFKVKDDGAGKGQAAQGLPVHAQVDAGKREVRDLAEAVGGVGILGRHEHWLVDFESPGAALDGAGSGQLGEVAGN